MNPPLVNLPWDTLVLAALVISLAYTVFGLTGFGSSITAMPLLVQLVPLKLAVPMMLLLDMIAGLLLLSKNRRHVAMPEIRPLLPFMLAGCLLGLTLLVHAPERILLLVLGVFVLAHCAWSLSRRGASRPLARGWAVPAGTVGGVLTSLFGTGGPIYAIYLARRIDDKHALRSSLALLILISAFARLGLFAWAGLMVKDVALTAAVLLPFAIGGMFAGSHLHGILSPQRVVQGTWALLIASGAGLVWRNAF